MSQKTLFTKSALAVAVALISTQAWSAGFQLNEFSSSGLGRAYSGEGAIADDAGNVSRNPALITMFDRPTFSAGARLNARTACGSRIFYRLADG